MLKIGFGALAVFALLFGFISLAQNLKLSFKEGGNSQSEDSSALLEETKLKVIDTDSDGLNDWDELNTYNTSPYLADSDSDGIKDMDEIKKGTNPNCPAGKECGTSLQKPALPAQAEGAAESNTADSQAETLPIEELKQLSPAEIKELLKQGGVTDEELEGVSDEELKQLLEETVGEQ